MSWAIISDLLVRDEIKTKNGAAAELGGTVFR